MSSSHWLRTKVFPNIIFLTAVCTMRLSPDVIVPHMFCVEGMTRYRSLVDLLQNLGSSAGNL